MLKVWFATLIAFSAGMLVSGTSVWLFESSRLQDRRQAVADEARYVADDIQDHLSHSLSATYALAAVIRQGSGTVPNFPQLAKEMLGLYPGISSLQLAPQGVIRQIFPLEGNEKAIGHNLLDDMKRNKEALLAIRTRSLTLAGPFDLIQGGKAIIGRLPIFLTDQAGVQYFWGFSAAVIRIPDFVSIVNIGRISAKDCSYEISRLHPDSGKRDVFSAAGKPLKSPVSQKILVPNGEWTLSVEPMNGWYSPGVILIESLFILLFSSISAIVVWWLTSQPIVLQYKVEESTRELSATNAMLEKEIMERKHAEEERLQLEKQLLHAQKLESLGVLAGGIAHDFNNILMAIMGNADLALMRITKESPAVENLHRIEQAAAQAADLAKQMLAYSGKGRFVIENIDLNCLLEEMLHMLEVSISKKAVLRFNLTKSLPSVEADATQMRQIIMNLVINASEAIGDTSGVIAITTGCMDCERSYLKDVWLDENLSDGLYVYLEISDTGCGMDKDTMARLFDPFFTTKFTGRGLGMAAVLGIVRGHKGAIKVYSEPGKGTSFKILLPASDRPVELFNHDHRADEWQGSGTVLLVDDEETVRGIGREMLKELGFDVVTANDGREAVDVFKARNDISFVILDLTMPHMDGEQCFRELRQMKPDVKVIMSSGYNEHEVSQKFIGKGLAGFIQKPYRLSTLLEAVRNL